jgi:hypothetical protein
MLTSYTSCGSSLSRALVADIGNHSDGHKHCDQRIESDLEIPVHIRGPVDGGLSQTEVDGATSGDVGSWVGLVFMSCVSEANGSMLLAQLKEILINQFQAIVSFRKAPTEEWRWIVRTGEREKR